MKKLTKASPRFPEVYPELVVLYGDQEKYEKAAHYFAVYKRLRNADEAMIEKLKTIYPNLE
jgi:hypothetical protein